MSTLDHLWDVPLQHRKGGEKRLRGIDVFHEFDWLEVFPDRRTQFKNGQCLAKFVQETCPPGKIPALLLTCRDEPKQGFLRTPRFFVFVVNLPEYTATAGDAARSYLASHLGIDITSTDELQALAASADPDVLRAFVSSHLDVEHIRAWVADSQERVDALRDVLLPAGRASTLIDTIAALGALTSLDAAEIKAIAELFGPEVDRSQR